LASQSLFEDDPVRVPARKLAAELGQRSASFVHAFGEPLPDTSSLLSALAIERFLPALNLEQWTMAVLAAAIRAYVPSVDAHGQWAPLEEEWSLYAGDAAIDAAPRLWHGMTRTAVGVRVTEPATKMLKNGDLVLAIGGIPTVGLSIEQTEQLSHLEPVGAETTRTLLILRPSEPVPRQLVVELLADFQAEPSPPELTANRVRYGRASVLVVTLDDVPDRLGEQLAGLIARHRQQEDPVGVLLDLRGNGGGSTDGAIGAIGVFLPGEPMVSLLLRGGGVEVQRAPTPARAGQWDGPVAVLVDGYTASAAEMIAGVIDRYERGTLLGSPTFGKGCVQEYFDDRSGQGILRLTTMLFSLPDGSALQRVGLKPALELSLPKAAERESGLVTVPPAWRGPDIRSPRPRSFAAWPPHGGRIGPCSDAWVCQALSRLGIPRRAAATTRSAGPRR
jgi:carboxyl-terminal processing protease